MRMSGDEHDEDGLGRGRIRSPSPARWRLTSTISTSSPAPRPRSPAPSISCRRWPCRTAMSRPSPPTVKQAVGKPVSRHRPHQPAADRRGRSWPPGPGRLCGMTRAMICDPEMPNKAQAGAIDDIRACIGCNQACIGHFQLGLSDLLHPASRNRPRTAVRHSRPAATPQEDHGRRRRPGRHEGRGRCGPARPRRDISTSATRGLGGQALLAQLLPGRAEFGGIITNLDARG